VGLEFFEGSACGQGDRRITVEPAAYQFAERWQGHLSHFAEQFRRRAADSAVRVRQGGGQRLDGRSRGEPGDSAKGTAADARVMVRLGVGEGGRHLAGVEREQFQGGTANGGDAVERGNYGKVACGGAVRIDVGQGVQGGLAHGPPWCDQEGTKAGRETFRQSAKHAADQGSPALVEGRARNQRGGYVKQGSGELLCGQSGAQAGRTQGVAWVGRFQGGVQRMVGHCRSDPVQTRCWSVS
jgi:hypothetical protein